MAYTWEDYQRELRETDKLERRMSRMDRKIGRELVLIQDELRDFYGHLKFVATNVHMPYRVKDAGLKYYFQGLNRREIANKLHTSEFMVGKYLHDFRNILRKPIVKNWILE